MAGSTSVTHYALGALRRIQIDWTGDAANGSVPNTVLPAFEGEILAIETNPGSTAPTDNYDIALNDAEGLDRLNGAGQNRDTANTESAAVAFTSTSIPIPVDLDDVLTLAISDNSVNSATGRIVIFYRPAGAA